MSDFKKNNGDYIINFIIGIILSVISVICLYPIIYILFASFSDPTRLVQHTGLLFYPLEPTLEGYKIALGYSNVWTGYKNTFIIVVVGTAINMLMTILAAYILSRKSMYIHRFINFFVIFTMYFNGGLIPFYLLVKNLGLVNSIWSLIFPVALNTWNLIILRTAIISVPANLEESAKIDGANDFVILFQIIVPLVKSSLAVLVLYYIVGHWNSWFNASIFLKSRDLYPLQLVMREIIISNTSNPASGAGVSITEIDNYKQLVKYCITIIATVPILFIYPFLQKYFVKGVMVGALKG